MKLEMCFRCEAKLNASPANHFYWQNITEQIKTKMVTLISLHCDQNLCGQAGKCLRTKLQVIQTSGS